MLFFMYGIGICSLGFNGLIWEMFLSLVGQIGENKIRLAFKEMGPTGRKSPKPYRTFYIILSKKLDYMFILFLYFFLSFFFVFKILC